MIPHAFDQVEAVHILALIGTDEGRTLDFKEELPADTREGKSSFVDDVVALANTAGGDVVFGIRETAGTATEIVPVIVDVDATILRLENLVRDAVEPALRGVRMRLITVDAAGGVLLVRVPRTTSGIHRNKYNNRFLVRESRSNSPLDVVAITNRLRDLIGQEDRLTTFFAERYAAIVTDTYPIALRGGPKLVMHLFPQRDFLNGEEIDLSPLTEPGEFPVLGAHLGGKDSTPAHEGWVHYTAAGHPETRAGVILFRNGVTEGVAALFLEGDEELRFGRIEEWCFQFLLRALPIVVDHMTDGWPVLMRIAIVGVAGVTVQVPGNAIDDWDGRMPVRVQRTVLQLPERRFEAPLTNNGMLRFLQPTFDRIWQSWGYRASRSYTLRDGGLHWRDAGIFRD